MARDRHAYHTFKVWGSFRFPLDMLRYDQCWPRLESQMHLIEGSLTHELRGGVQEDQAIEMASCQPIYWKPTAGRWESFGWKVKDHKAER